MYARVTTVKGQPGQRDQVSKVIIERVIPEAKKLRGFVGGYWLGDDSGTGLAITLWESDEAMKASREPAQRLRDDATRAVQSTVQSVEEFEVVAHTGAVVAA